MSKYNYKYKENAYSVSEILIIFIIIAFLLFISCVRARYSVENNAPECILSNDPITCTRIK